MPRAVYTSEAEGDLRQIAAFIARDNLSAALAWLDDIRSTCDLLATQPEVGERLQTNRFGEVRRHVRGNYVIYHQAVPEAFLVVRVLHGAREQGHLL